MMMMLVRLLKTLWDHLEKQMSICSKTIWTKIVDLVIKTIIR